MLSKPRDDSGTFPPLHLEMNILKEQIPFHLIIEIELGSRIY